MRAQYINLLSVLAVLQLYVSVTFASPAIKEGSSSLRRATNKDAALKCSVDEDCNNLLLCKDNKTNCYCNPKTSRCDWRDHTIRPRWRRSVSDNAVVLEEDDIGPDTCGKDRMVLSNWFLTHGSPNLLEEPIPENVLPTDPNPFDDPYKPPLQPDEISGTIIRVKCFYGGS